MTLWTDLIDPATLTGYARRSLEEYEAEKGSLARWLPNREVADTVVRFVSGQKGGAKPRVSSPEPLRSILITSAPRSPSIWVQVGPARTRVRSRTRRPVRGPAGLVMAGVSGALGQA